MASAPDCGIGNGTPGSTFSMAMPSCRDLALAAFFRVLSSSTLGNAAVRWLGYTSMWKLGKRLASSTVVAVSESVYWSTFLPSITSSGFSEAKGSGRRVSPCLKPAGGVFRPPW
ncbi:hypothetical protein D3C76_1040900 [compost metagenome]